MPASRIAPQSAVPAHDLSIAEVATALGVSQASVRNWIKTGYLTTGADRQVNHASFVKFRDDVAGKAKLRGRANKSRRDAHDHKALMASIRADLARDTTTGDALAARYEQSLSNAHKNSAGVYYTPPDIARQFFAHISVDTETATFCDPCCGTGNFLIAALKAGFKPENIYGFDIDQTAVAIAKRRMQERTGREAARIECADYLTRSHAQKFDVIFTNPPWGQKLAKSVKTRLGKRFGAGKSLDSAALFYFSCAQAAKPKGFLGLLLPEAFFNIATFGDARAHLLGTTLHSLFDFGKPFKGLLTRARGFIASPATSAPGHLTACFLKNIPSFSFLRLRVEGDHEVVEGVLTFFSFERTQASFAANPMKIINLACPPQDAAVIERLYAVPHVTLAGRGQWGLGIVTGNNARFCQPVYEGGLMPVYAGADIFADHLAEPTRFIPKDLGLYQQVAPKVLYEAPQKLIYRFISSNLVFFHDTDQRYVLNSANMLVVDEAFAVSPPVVARLFNSRLMNGVFKRLFDTHKILRSDIEKLPIPHLFLAAHPDFSEAELLDYFDLTEDGDSFKIKG